VRTRVAALFLIDDAKLELDTDEPASLGAEPARSVLVRHQEHHRRDP